MREELKIYFRCGVMVMMNHFKMYAERKEVTLLRNNLNYR